MKTLIGSMLFVIALATGCSHNTAAPNTASNASQDEQPLPDKCPRPEHPTTRCKDNFDRAGEMVAGGSRWVYDEGKAAWVYLSSEEMKVKYKEAWEATKKAASETWDAAKEKLNEHK